MRRTIPVAVLVAALLGAPAASAASSPTVAAGAVTGTGNTYARLHGTVNANALATTYQFDYGPTSALGKAVPVTAATVGSGTTAVSETNRIGGLSPDTTYYYELVATNADGTSTTPIQSFRTTGNPAPTSTTDVATNVGRNFATLVGTIAPNNQATTYFFQYGLTSSYGYQTAPATIPTGTAPTPVTGGLPGLAAGTMYHFRLVASHGPTATTYGNDMTFETLPWPRRHTTLTLRVRRYWAGVRAASVIAKGSIGLAASTSTSLGCSGVVTVRYYRGSRHLATSRALVGPHCGYTAGARIRYRGTMRLRVKASFSGNVYQAPVNRRAQLKLG